MKKLLTFVLLLVMVASLASCAYLPEDLQASINGAIENIKEAILGTEPSPDPDDNPGEGEHTHDFVYVSTTEAKCDVDGFELYKCECGEEQTSVIEATGHNVKLLRTEKPTCIRGGTRYYGCSNCGGQRYSEAVDPLGHEYSVSTEPSRFSFCIRDNCTSFVNSLGSEGKYSESLTFNFTDEHEAALVAKYDEVLAAIDAAAEYDPALHGYQNEGALADEFAAVDALHTEYYELILYAIAQRQIAEIDYYCNMNNDELEERYSYMMDYYTDLIAKFYSLSQPFYDSCYRDFFYYGMTEEEIVAYLFDSNALADEEYTALKSRNDQIELEFFDIADPATDPQVPVLYAEFVANNKRIAEILGYDNYLEYAYENVYGREYSHEDVAVITDYVAEHLGGSFKSIFSTYIYNYSNPLLGTSKEEYRSQFDHSFFENMKSNVTLNDYIDLLAFTSNPDKQISFSDELNGLVSNGNLFIGQYEGAFVTSLEAFHIPIAYFSNGYDTPFTVVHEFGHYMNEIYNSSEYNQSYDLLEMHSQGNEMLYLSFLKGELSEQVFKYVENEQLVNMLSTVIASLAIDAFERAIYTDSYDGSNADIIMADGTITYDEYDMLYRSINTDLGVNRYLSDVYWRYGMTIASPCYYVSYAISGLSVLQLYEIAETDGFDAAADAYLKLFTYTDENPDMTTEEVLVYAGMYSYNDEELYVALEAFIN